MNYSCCSGRTHRNISETIKALTDLIYHNPGHSSNDIQGVRNCTFSESEWNTCMYTNLDPSNPTSILNNKVTENSSFSPAAGSLSPGSSLLVVALLSTGYIYSACYQTLLHNMRLCVAGNGALCFILQFLLCTCPFNWQYSDGEV